MDVSASLGSSLSTTPYDSTPPTIQPAAPPTAPIASTPQPLPQAVQVAPSPVPLSTAAGVARLPPDIRFAPSVPHDGAIARRNFEALA